MTLGDVISEYRAKHGLSMEKFAEMSGISKGYISMLERNQTQRGEEPSPSYEMYKNVARTIGIDVDELIRTVEGKISLHDSLPDNIIPMPDIVKKPRLGTIACGVPILAEENIEAYDDVPAWIKCDFTLLCKGDSMINARIFDGDVVCVKMQPTVESGEIAAVMVGDNEATLKRVKLFEDHVVLEPENPMYKPLTFWGEEMNKVHIIGKATHFISAVR